MKKLLKLASHFKTVLPAEDFILTGSVALNMMGFKSNPKDLDLILFKPTSGTLEVLKDLVKKYPPKTKGSYPNNGHVYRFTHDDVEIDVFITSGKIESELYTGDKIKIYPLDKIVQAKILMNRPKDYIQLLKMSKQIISENQFERYVENFNS